MKILQINNVYNTGSTGKITADIHNELLNSGVESIVCYGRGKDTTENNVHKVCSEYGAKMNSGLAQITGIPYIAFPFSLRKITSIIKIEKPDIVHLQCINGFFVNIYSLISWLNKNNIKTIITLHAEFMFTANCPYSFQCLSWENQDGCKNCNTYKEATNSMFFNNTRRSFLKMKKSFEGFKDTLTVVSVSPWLCNRSKKSYILGEMKNITILNGINTDVFRLYDTVPNKNKTVIHVTAQFSDTKGHIKGGSYIIRLAENMPDITFIVVASVIDIKTTLPKNIKLNTKSVSQRELGKMYSNADLSIITSKKETFSMPVAESLCCGTPVVGFKAGGPESITIEEYSQFVDYGDLNKLEKAIRDMLSKFSEKDKENISQMAIKKFSKKNMTENYKLAYSELLNRS